MTPPSSASTQKAVSSDEARGTNKEKGGTLNTAKMIERVRLERGIPVAELARRIGVDRKRLWRVLNGKREMRVDEFLALCVALRIDPRAFVSAKTVREIAKRCVPSQDARAP